MPDRQFERLNSRIRAREVLDDTNPLLGVELVNAKRDDFTASAAPRRHRRNPRHRRDDDGRRHERPRAVHRPDSDPNCIEHRTDGIRASASAPSESATVTLMPSRADAGRRQLNLAA